MKLCDHVPVGIQWFEVRIVPRGEDVEWDARMD